MGGIGGRGGIEMASANTQSANEPARTSFLCTQLKPMIKVQISGRIIYRAFSPLVIVGVASPILVAMVTVFYILKE